MPEHRKAEVQRSVEQIESKVREEATRSRDFRSATELVQGLKKRRQLTENKLAEFAAQRQYETIVVALAAFTNAPVDLIRPLMRPQRSEGLVVACRAAELSWETTRAVIQSRLTASASDLAKLRRQYDETSVEIARRTLHIWKEQAFRKRVAS